MISVSVVLATFNRKSYLRTLLNQILSLRTPKNYKINTIVTIDGSTDGTSEMLKKDFPFVITINGTGNWWWTKSMNEGFKKAVELDSDFVLVLNDDVEIEQDYLIKLFDDYKRLPELSILGSASISIDEPHRIESAGTKKFIRWRMKMVPYFSGHPLMTDSFYGINPSFTLSGRGTLIPTQLFNKIGFYDENLVQYGSDDEFCLRAKMNNYGVYISWNARVYNHTFLTSQSSAFKKSTFSSFIKSFFNIYSVNSISKAKYLYKKYGYRLFWPVYILIFVLGTFKAYFFNYKNNT